MTAYHAKYFAHELTKRCAWDSVEKLATALSNAQVDLKLPSWFEVDTPVGKYNPDWAILTQDGQAMYLVRETKGTKDFLKLRTSGADKVRGGQRHFEAIGVPFSVAVTADEV